MKSRLGIAVALLVVSVVLVVGVHMGWWRFSGTVGSLRLNHLLGIVGATYVLVSIPVYALVRRQSALHQGQPRASEVFGNLMAFMLISAHFAQQTSRSPLPDLGTGVTAYALVAVLVCAGVVWHFAAVGRGGTGRLLYFGALLALYVDVGIHALRNFGVV